jgi:hypothetical protein
MSAPQQDSNNTIATASISFGGLGAVVFWALGFGLAIGLAVWALVRSGDALDAAKRASDRIDSAGVDYREKAAKLGVEYRLTQEDLMMLRAAVKAHGVSVETAHDHD